MCVFQSFSDVFPVVSVFSVGFSATCPTHVATVCLWVKEMGLAMIVTETGVRLCVFRVPQLWLQECLPRQTENHYRRNACCHPGFTHPSWHIDNISALQPFVTSRSRACDLEYLASDLDQAGKCVVHLYPFVAWEGWNGPIFTARNIDIDRSCVALRVHFLVRLFAIASSRSVFLHHVTSLVYFFAELLRRQRQNSASTKGIDPRAGLQEKPTRGPC